MTDYGSSQGQLVQLCWRIPWSKFFISTMLRNSALYTTLNTLMLGLDRLQQNVALADNIWIWMSKCHLREIFGQRYV